MKGRRIICCMLAALLLLPHGALAVTEYPDVTGNWAWAKQYIMDMTQRGIYTGYEDGTFRPEKELPAVEALALSARCVELGDAVTQAIAKKRAGEIAAILGTSVSWAHENLALCLELGVITPAELKSLHQTGALGRAVSKEDFSVYLVRAMGLGRLAETLPSYSMSFADAPSISQKCRPYVYLLNAYGVVQGNAENKFEPASPLNRAVSATMISRVVDVIKQQGIVLEMPEYTDCDWNAGTIDSVVAGEAGAVQLTLAGAGGAQAVVIPAAVPIYMNNMPAYTTDLQAGAYARVCLDRYGRAESVRLVPAERLRTVSADIVALGVDSITLRHNGAENVYRVNRFTGVAVGKAAGDRTLIDTAANYESAVCTVDGSDVLMMQLTGGSTVQTGLISSVSTGAAAVTLQVTSFDGLTRAFTVPHSAAVTVNGLAGTLKADHAGRYIFMRVSDDESGQVTAAAVDTQTSYVRGSVVGVVYTSKPDTLYATDLQTGESAVYTVADNAAITYEGSAVLFRNIAKGWYFTARLGAGGKIEMLEAHSGALTVKGTLAFVRYGADVMLTVNGEDGEAYAFSLDMKRLPEILRDGKTSYIDRLRPGDSLTLTSKYGAVTLIEATPQAANVTGTIIRIIQEAAGNTLELKLDDGSTASYTVTEATPVTKDGSAVNIGSLKPGYTLALVANDTQVTSIEITGTDVETSSTELTGTVLYINNSARTILLRLSGAGEGEGEVTVNAPAGTAVLSVDGGSWAFSKLAIGDVLTIYGTYARGEFDARIIVQISKR